MSYRYLTDRLPDRRPLALLDIGCSDCREGEALLTAGVSLTGIDQDEVTIQAAQRRLPQATFRCADAADFNGHVEGRFEVVLIRRPDLFAQPDRWRRVVRRLPQLLTANGGLILTTISAAEATLAERWLLESGFVITSKEELTMTDETMIITASMDEKTDEKTEVKTEKGPFKPFKSWDEGATVPVCDLTTGKCSD